MNALSSSHSLSTTDYVVSKNARRFDDVPGPSKFQLLRGFIPGGKFYGHSMKDFGNICRKEYGDLFKISAGFGVPSVVMSFNPDHFEKVFRTEGVCPFRRPSASLSYFRENIRKDYYGEMLGLTLSNNEEWKRIRETVNLALIRPNSRSLLFPKIVNINNEFVELIRQIRNTYTFEVPDDFIMEIRRWTLGNILEAVLDDDLGMKRNDLKMTQLLKNISRTTELAYEMDVMPPVWKFVSTPSSKEMISVLDEIQDTLENLVDNAIQNINLSKKEEEQSLLQRLVSIDRKLACVTVIDMLLAGLDTTTTIFTGILLSMGTNPDKQEILRNEVLKTLPDQDSTLSLENLGNMSYLKACIKESIRIYPAGAGTARRTNQDLEIDGYRIPKGIDFIINTEALMRDPRYFSEPNKFLPERWLEEDSNDLHPFAYLPFGYGPRMCIAKEIADLVLEVGLIKIIRNFKVEYNYPPKEVFTSYLLNTPKVPLRFKFTTLN